MKNLTSLLSAFSLLFAVSCGGGSSSSTGGDALHDSALVGRWMITTMNGRAWPLENGIEFKSSGAFTTIGFDATGGCDESGAWTTANPVLTTTTTAVSPGGVGCFPIGRVENSTYSVQGNIYTKTYENGAFVNVYTKS